MESSEFIAKCDRMCTLCLPEQRQLFCYEAGRTNALVMEKLESCRYNCSTMIGLQPIFPFSLFSKEIHCRMPIAQNVRWMRREANSENDLIDTVLFSIGRGCFFFKFMDNRCSLTRKQSDDNALTCPRDFLVTSMKKSRLS